MGQSLAIALLLGAAASAACAPALRVSVYATAGGLQKYLSHAEGRQAALARLRQLGISRIFLEGRRGDEYVPAGQLRALADYFRGEGLEVSGGIATVPGRSFGVRQTGALNWLNFQAAKTQADIAAFFRENAPLFDELIIDDFYCTADTSPESESARGQRSWAEYRQQLLLSLVQPMILEPARTARPGVRVILKYPQWYDRFHLFGYDPARLSPNFDAIWVGTEVRNPETPRMGYVQPTQGYINFCWLRAVAGERVRGAWFDHIECTAQNFLDQAYQSVLAGARELTLFHLGDLIAGHPGDALLAQELPELFALAEKLRGREPRGVAFYKPAGSDSDENMYLMDYLAMMGVPLVPVARYPEGAACVVLGVQAAADADLFERVRKHAARGATVVLTPALLRRVPALAGLAGVKVAAQAEPAVATEVKLGRRVIALDAPLELDLGLKADRATVLIAAPHTGGEAPLLTRRKQMLVWNVRTFSEEDFRQTGEWLLPPKPLGIVRLPETVVNALRRVLLEPLGLRLQAPVRVALYDFNGWRCLYNFRSEPVRVELNRKALRLEPHRLRCGADL